MDGLDLVIVWIPDLELGIININMEVISMYDIIVIGAGPAGLSAAIYAQRSGKQVLILEGKSYGGQIINTSKIENYPGIKEVSGFGFAKDLYEQAKAMGAEICYETCTKIESMDTVVKNEDLERTEQQNQTEKDAQVDAQSTTADQKGFVVSCPSNQYTCQSIILAVGAVNRKLGVDRETELTGKGVSYCATCDGAFYRGKNVAVVGGGNTALEDALFLSNYCSHVYLIHRRNTFRGEKQWERLLREKDNVHFCLEQTVSALSGEDHLQGLTMKHVVTGEEVSLDVEGLFIAVGQMPATGEFASLLETDQGGYVMAGEDCQTSIPGIYVAGDCRSKQVRQLTTAVADGSVSALAACAYCEQI